MGIPCGEGSDTWISNLEASRILARKQQDSCGGVKGTGIQLLNKMYEEVNLAMMNLESGLESLDSTANYQDRTQTHETK